MFSSRLTGRLSLPPLPPGVAGRPARPFLMVAWQ